MNTLDAYVMAILDKPRLKYGKYFVKVLADCYGLQQEYDIMFDTKQEALALKTGDRVQV